MTKYNNEDNDEDDDRNKDGNDDDSTASGSGSDGLIFHPIMTPWYHEGVLVDDNDGTSAAAHYISMRHTIYLPYKSPIKYAP